MWLALDAGNSNVVVGVFADSPALPKPLRTFRLSTHPIGTADEFRAKLQTILSLSGDTALATILEDNTPVVLASVVPAFTRVAHQAFGSLRVIHADWPFSFKIGTDHPAQTGTDRLVNAEAVAREGRLPAIIIDSGTATTICALGEDKVFRGGAILPGLEAHRDALAGRTAQLSMPELSPPHQAIGKNTQDALRSGIVLGYASMIDGMIRRFKKEMPGTPPRVIATGGAAGLLRELCAEIEEVDPDLTLKGIAYLAAPSSHR